MKLLTKAIISKFEKHPFGSQSKREMDAEVLVKYSTLAVRVHGLLSRPNAKVMIGGCSASAIFSSGNGATCCCRSFNPSSCRSVWA